MQNMHRRNIIQMMNSSSPVEGIITFPYIVIAIIILWNCVFIFFKIVQFFLTVKYIKAPVTTEPNWYRV